MENIREVTKFGSFTCHMDEDSAVIIYPGTKEVATTFYIKKDFRDKIIELYEKQKNEELVTMSKEEKEEIKKSIFSGFVDKVKGITKPNNKIKLNDSDTPFFNPILVNLLRLNGSNFSNIKGLYGSMYSFGFNDSDLPDQGLNFVILRDENGKIVELEFIDHYIDNKFIVKYSEKKDILTVEFKFKHYIKGGFLEPIHDFKGVNVFYDLNGIPYLIEIHNAKNKVNENFFLRENRKNLGIWLTDK